MCTRKLLLLVVVAVGFSMLVSLSVTAASDEDPYGRDASYYRTQAAEYRQEAGRLNQAIQRYEIMERIYQNGSDRSSGTMNPQGRRLMVERTKRVIQYFAQKKQETERQAAEHEALAQALPDR
jgi:hypothetical protein